MVEFLANVVRLPQVTLVTRLRLDAALSDPAPARETGKKGRPAVKGTRQPTLATRLTDPAPVWQTHTVSWDGGIARSVEMATGTALWSHAGIAPVPIRFLCSVVIHKATSPPRPCCVPINRLIRFRSWSGVSCVGRST